MGGARVQCTRGSRAAKTMTAILTKSQRKQPTNSQLKDTQEPVNRPPPNKPANIKHQTPATSRLQKRWQPLLGAEFRPFDSLPVFLGSPLLRVCASCRGAAPLRHAAGKHAHPSRGATEPWDRGSAGPHTTRICGCCVGARDFSSCFVVFLVCEAGLFRVRLLLMIRSQVLLVPK